MKKRILAAGLSAVMALSMGATALAADDQMDIAPNQTAPVSSGVPDDVADTAWYKAAVDYVLKYNLIDLSAAMGGKVNFEPEVAITREEVAETIFRDAKLRNVSDVENAGNALKEMADYSEIDVQTTADGIMVVCHDLNLKRGAGGDRLLGTMTYDQVSRLDVGSHFSPSFAGERIPTLEEVLEACKGRMKLNIELKNIGNSSSLPEQVAALVREYGMEDQCVITSVKLGYLERVKEMAPELRTGYILAAAYGTYYDNEYIDFISIRSSFVGRKLVEAAHEKGKAVHVWTVNSKTEIEQMKLLGVDNIITDYPVRAREILYREETTETLMEYVKLRLR